MTETEERCAHLDAAEAHELYGLFIGAWSEDEIDHGHPLYTGAMKLGAISDPEHPRFSQHVDEWNPEKLRAQRDEALARVRELEGRE